MRAEERITISTPISCRRAGVSSSRSSAPQRVREMEAAAPLTA